MSIIEEPIKQNLDLIKKIEKLLETKRDISLEDKEFYGGELDKLKANLIKRQQFRDSIDLIFEKIEKIYEKAEKEKDEKKRKSMEMFADLVLLEVKKMTKELKEAIQKRKEDEMVDPYATEEEKKKALAEKSLEKREKLRKERTKEVKEIEESTGVKIL